MTRMILPIRLLGIALSLCLETKSAPADDAPSLAPLPPATALNPELVELGRRLFFEPKLSGDAGTSCASCHDPAKNWSDGLALSKGYPGTMYFRRTPSLVNSSMKTAFYWDGRLGGDDLPTVVRDHLSEAHFMQADGRLVIERLRQVPFYEDAFRRTTGGDVSYGRILDAVSEFVRSIRSTNVPLDRFLAGDEAALSPQAKKGRLVFVGKARCIECHHGPLLSDGKFHDLGVPENPEIFRDPLRHITLRRFLKSLGVGDYRSARADRGRAGITHRKADRGKFLTPTLREVARSDRFMHNGVFASLREVIDFYDRGGDAPGVLPALHLAEEEKSALAAFLESLSGDEIPVEAPAELEYEERAPGERPASSRPMTPDDPARRLAAPAPLAPLGAPPIPLDNPQTPNKVELGRRLFFDARLSGDVSTSCASCHDPAAGWGDGSDLSRGYPGTAHWRNSQTIVNAAYLLNLFWAGEADSLEAQAHAAITGALAGNADPAMIEERLAQCPDYVKRFDEAFGTPRPLYRDVLQAIAAYERTLVQRDTPFDRYLQGDASAISAQAKRGLALFQGKANCVQCHNGPLLTDEGYHNLGVPENEAFEWDPLRQTALRYQYHSRGVPEAEYRSAATDLGLYFTTKRDSDKGKFRTHSLRYLLYTPPYMHNGVLSTLEEVVDFYNAGGGDVPGKSPLIKPLGLAETEKKELIAFLSTLTGEEIIHEPPELPPYVSAAGEGDAGDD